MEHDWFTDRNVTSSRRWLFAQNISHCANFALIIALSVDLIFTTEFHESVKVIDGSNVNHT